MSNASPGRQASRHGAGEDLRIGRARITDPEAQAMVAEVQAEYTALYGGPDDTPLDQGVFEAPSGAFFVGYLTGTAVVMGGWRFRPDVTALGRSRAAEVKRMYVVPAARRTGQGRVLLAHLEQTAHDAGADLMVLETGVLQPEAISLYSSSGYEPVEAFGHYAWSSNARYFGKRL
jgi:GNAT superfamily N-acetyltransferase